MGVKVAAETWMQGWTWHGPHKGREWSFSFLGREHAPVPMAHSLQHTSWLLKSSFCVQDFLQMEGLKMLHWSLDDARDNRDDYRSIAARPKMVTAVFFVPIIKLIRSLMRT